MPRAIDTEHGFLFKQPGFFFPSWAARCRHCCRIVTKWDFSEADALALLLDHVQEEHYDGGPDA